MEKKTWLDKYEIESFIGRNSGYYLEKWGNNRDKKIKGINIAALFFPAQWLGYRKLYTLFALSYFAVGLMYFLNYGNFLLYENHIINFLIIKYPFYAFLLVKVLLGVYFAVFGNGMYRNNVLLFTQEHARFSSKDKYVEHLKKVGGTSIITPVISVLIDAGILLFLYFSMYEAMNYNAEFLSF